MSFLQDWVQQIAGDAVEAHALLPPGASPHTFEPTPQIAEQAGQASLRVVIGLGVDDWALHLASAPGAATVVLGEQVQTMPMASPDLDEGRPAGGPDPHVWMDPLRAAQMVAALTPELVKLVPAQKAAFEQRSQAYQKQLTDFAAQMEQRFRPYAGRHVVTMHGAFDYLLLRCGLPAADVITEFPGKEPSTQYLESLGLKARRENIKVVFTEPQISPKAADVLAQEIGGQTLILDEVGNAEDPTRNTYLKLLQFDTDELFKGLALNG
ncbi:MAG TPA: metal ABC transporter substrate-binding protein [Armatimonadota bacterium]|jgi:zinc transport system substrate-binding protein